MPTEPALPAAAYRMSTPAVAAQLLNRLRADTRALLERDHLTPPQLVNAALAAEDEELLGCLGSFGRYHALRGHARLDRPAVAHLLYGKGDWSARDWRAQEVRRAVLAAAAARPDDPGWRAPGGLVPTLLATDEEALLHPALRAPFPEVVHHAMATLLPRVDLPDQYAACRAVLVHGGREQLDALLHVPGGLHPEVARTAGEHPERLLTRTGTDDALSLLRQVNDAGRLFTHSTHSRVEDLAVDWETVLAAHRADPLPDAALLDLWSLLRLGRLPGCPQALLLAAYERSDRQVPDYYRGPALPMAVVSGERWRDAARPHQVPHVLTRGVTEGWFPVDRVLAEVAPARSVLTRLPRTPDVRRALAHLVAPLGPAAGTWQALLQLLPGFAGSCAELVATAVARGPGSGRQKRWRRGGNAFLRLLASAPEPTQSALVPLLQTADAHRLFVAHDVPDRVRALITADMGPAELAWLAGEPGLGDAACAHLFGRDVPEVNAALFGQLSTQQRRALLAGEPQRPGSSAPVPLHPDLPARLRQHAPSGRTAWQRRYWLLAVGSGDPVLARMLLGRTALHTPGARLALLVRLWERHGPEAVRGVLEETVFAGREPARHPLPAKLRKEVHGALGSEDGLKTLRQRLETEQGPAGRIAFLRAGSKKGTTAFDRAGQTVTVLAEETAPEPLPWDELVTAHRSDPLPDALLAALAGRPDSPRAFARERLRRGRLDPSGPDDHRWLSDAVDQGRLTAHDLVHDMRPAVHLVCFLMWWNPHSHETVSWHERSLRSLAPALRPVRRLVSEQLGEDAEAWTTALALLPDFDGTLPELLATAKAVVS